MKNELDRSVALWQLLAKDTNLSRFVTDADFALFKRRTMAEGMTFLTVTLPALGKALDRSFQSGSFVLPEGWRPAKNAPYPAFLGKCWRELLSNERDVDTTTDSGDFSELSSVEEGIRPLWLADEDGDRCILPALLPRSMVDAVACIRQLTFVFYKYELPWTDAQASATFEAFKATEEELTADVQRLVERHSDPNSEDGVDSNLERQLDVAERYIARLLRGTDPIKGIRPRYGTGATACKSTPWGRWEKPRFIPKLDEVYPYDEWFFSGINGLDSHLSGSRLDLPVCHEPLARVVLVPKDSRGPRLISAEPREFMYIQQGLMGLLYDTIERYVNVRSQVSCRDQTRNQYLASLGSETGGLATLDLKEASDRVSWWLVTRLFPEIWVRAFSACRSESTELPNGTVTFKEDGKVIDRTELTEEVPLWKFAPMGSACCFPVEALIFWALSNAAKECNQTARLNAMFGKTPMNADLGRGFTSSRLTDVCVFGDDIIVPTHDVDRTVCLLEKVGLRVNLDKSFTKGPFRESCGADCFAGVDVTPLRVKSTLQGRNVGVLFRFVDLCNNLSLKYGELEPQLVIKLRELVSEFFGLKLPVMPVKHRESAPGLVILDYYWGNRLDGETLKPDEGKSAPRSTFTIVRSKTSGRGRNNMAVPYYHNLEIRTLTEVADEATRDLGWCSVLRSFHLSGGRGGTELYAHRKRVRYKFAWVKV